MRDPSTYRGARRNAVRRTGISAWRTMPLLTLTHKVKRFEKVANPAKPDALPKRLLVDTTRSQHVHATLVAA